MILGRGTAQTDAAIIEEYHHLIDEAQVTQNPRHQQALKFRPIWMLRKIQKPISQWTDDDILLLYQTEPAGTVKPCNVFLAFLFFRGYYHVSLSLLTSLPIQLAIQFRSVLEPHRQKLRDAQKALGYRDGAKRKGSVKGDGTGCEMDLLLWFLAVTHKSLEEVTRADFDRFEEEYHRWYRHERSFRNGRPDPHLFRLERLLLHLGIIGKKEKLLNHDGYFAHFPNSYIREALLHYLNWCQVKYRLKSIFGRRKTLHYFFAWLHENYPDLTRLDEVTRSLALEYATYVKKWCEDRHYSLFYRYQIYSSVTLFFDFVIDEQVETAPGRNPFSSSDMPGKPDSIPRYIPDQELQMILKYGETDATLVERTVITLLLHTEVRASELAALKASDMVQIGGVWKLHIREGKGLKDRIIPLTAKCVEVLRQWMASGWEQANDFLFTHYTHPWSGGAQVDAIIRQLNRKLGLQGVTPHRFRHTFAVVLLNYGVRESAIQKLMGHATLGMTLEYARILDETVERSFTQVLDGIQEGAMSWVPNFFVQEDYTLFAEGDSVSWIQLPVGFCRRNPKLHCESDVKCYLCERFCATPKDLPRLQQMYERFTKLGLKLKADVVSAQIQQLLTLPQNGVPVLIPTNAISVAPKRAERR
jgi:integrase